MGQVGSRGRCAAPGPGQSVHLEKGWLRRGRAHLSQSLLLLPQNLSSHMEPLTQGHTCTQHLPWTEEQCLSKAETQRPHLTGYKAIRLHCAVPDRAAPSPPRPGLLMKQGRAWRRRTNVWVFLTGYCV